MVYANALLTGRRNEMSLPARANAGALSPREIEIVELIGQGRSNKEIARGLGIAPETVKTHVKNIFSNLGVERRAQAVAIFDSVATSISTPAPSQESTNLTRWNTARR